MFYIFRKNGSLRTADCGQKILLLFLILFAFSDNSFAQIAIKRNTVLMGSRFDITIVAEDTLTANQHIDEVIGEIKRIEELISDWKPVSQISEVNRNAGIQPVKVDREVFDLAKRAIYFSEITDGAFDISFAAMDKIWRFDGSMDTLPDAKTIQKAIAKIGYQNIILDSKSSTIFLKLPGMKIGFGATGKGYAADRGRELMLSKGVKAGIVNASGDMAVWGNQPDGGPWKVGVTNPFKLHKVTEVLLLKSGAVTTSGDYQKYIEIDDVRYSHIINPKTGMPATGLTSVTVIGPNAEMANGFSTSIMVLGQKEGLLLLEKYPDYGCLIITNSGKIIKSKNWKVVKKLSKGKACR